MLRLPIVVSLALNLLAAIALNSTVEVVVLTLRAYPASVREVELRSVLLSSQQDLLLQRRLGFWGIDRCILRRGDLLPIAKSPMLGLFLLSSLGLVLLLIVSILVVLETFLALYWRKVQIRVLVVRLLIPALEGLTSKLRETLGQVLVHEIAFDNAPIEVVDNNVVYCLGRLRHRRNFIFFRLLVFLSSRRAAI